VTLCAWHSWSSSTPTSLCSRCVLQTEHVRAHGGSLSLSLFSLSLSLSHSLSLAPQVTWRVTSRQSFAMSDRLTRNNEINRRLKSDRDDFEDLLPESMRGDACPSLAPYDL
jgi:hypothetical protein